MTLLQTLERITTVREQEPMSRHTTYGIGGPADYYAQAHDRETLKQLAMTARQWDTPLMVVGSGSNILVGDAGLRGLVIANETNAIESPEPAGDTMRLRVATGAAFARVARHAARLGLHGLEWAAGIPGSMGGAVVYNAGAYGGCLADALAEVHTLNTDGTEETLAAEALGLAYRSSAFTRGLMRERVILDVVFSLTPGDADAALARIAELEARRKQSSPPGRNAGSTFKNPPQHPVWWLIDQVGLRGHRIGDAQISERHTNYFLNVGAARAADVVALMDLARQRVREQFGVELEAEVALVGEGFA